MTSRTTQSDSVARHLEALSIEKSTTSSLPEPDKGVTDIKMPAPSTTVSSLVARNDNISPSSGYTSSVASSAPLSLHIERNGISSVFSSTISTNLMSSGSSQEDPNPQTVSSEDRTCKSSKSKTSITSQTESSECGFEDVAPEPGGATRIAIPSSPDLQVKHQRHSPKPAPFFFGEPLGNGPANAKSQPEKAAPSMAQNLNMGGSMDSAMLFSRKNAGDIFTDSGHVGVESDGQRTPQSPRKLRVDNPFPQMSFEELRGPAKPEFEQVSGSSRDNFERMCSSNDDQFSGGSSPLLGNTPRSAAYAQQFRHRRHSGNIMHNSINKPPLPPHQRSSPSFQPLEIQFDRRGFPANHQPGPPVDYSPRGRPPHRYSRTARRLEPGTLVSRDNQFIPEVLMNLLQIQSLNFDIKGYQQKTGICPETGDDIIETGFIARPKHFLDPPRMWPRQDRRPAYREWSPRRGGPPMGGRGRPPMGMDPRGSTSPMRFSRHSSYSPREYPSGKGYPAYPPPRYQPTNNESGPSFDANFSHPHDMLYKPNELALRMPSANDPRFAQPENHFTPQIDLKPVIPVASPTFEPPKPTLPKPVVLPKRELCAKERLECELLTEMTNKCIAEFVDSD